MTSGYLVEDIAGNLSTYMLKLNENNQKVTNRPITKYVSENSMTLIFLLQA
jgi:hypothetical protein